jgi:hypothetical protein
MAVVYFRLLIGMIMLSLTYFGKAFGMSSNLRSCALWQAWVTRSLLTLTGKRNVGI